MAEITGGAAADLLAGTNGSDRFTGGAGNDTLEGRGGDDLAVYSGNAAGYRFSHADGYWRIEDVDPADGDDGVDLLRDVESLRFADRGFAIDNGGLARVDSSSSPAVGDVQAAALAGGGHVIVFTQADPADGSQTVVFRRYDAAGVMRGAESTVAGEVELGFEGLGVAALSDGGFVVIWDRIDDAGMDQVLVQAFDGAGGARGSVQTVAIGVFHGARVAGLADGGFVVAWSGYESGASAQRFGADAVPAGDAIVIDADPVPGFEGPALAALPDGGFVVAWADGGDEWAINTRRFDADGSAVGEPRQVESLPYESNPPGIDVTALADGDWLLSWFYQGDEFAGSRLFAQHVQADGNPYGSAFAVPLGSRIDGIFVSGTRPGFAATAEGGFSVSWISVTEGYSLLRQGFTADGSPLGTPVELVSYGLFGHFDEAPDTDIELLSLAGGGELAAWVNAEPPTHAWALHIGADGQVAAPLLRGSAGNDRIDLGGEGAVQAAGGRGDDVYIVNERGDAPVEAAGEGVDRVLTSIDWQLGNHLEILTLGGAAAIDGRGNALDNRILGNAADNVLSGAGGNDRLDGAGGADTASYAQASAGVVASLLLGRASDDGDGGSDVLVDIENLDGSAFADVLAGDGRGNVLSGGDGDDTVQGAGGDDTVLGGSGIDVLGHAGSADGYEFGAGADGRLLVRDVDAGDGREGSDRVFGTEALVFADRSFSVREHRIEQWIATDDASLMDAAVAGLADGGRVLVWTRSALDDDTQLGVFVRVLAPDGAVRADIHIPQSGWSRADDVALTVLADGSFVAVWSTSDETANGVHAQHFDADGTARGAVFDIDSGTMDHAKQIDVSALADGGFAVVWQRLSGICQARVYTSGDVPLGESITVAASASNTYFDVMGVSATPDGGFALAWAEGYSGEVCTVRVQRFDAGGVPRGAAVEVAQGERIVAARVDSLADGSLVVAWSEATATGGDAVVGRIVGADGTLRGSEFRADVETDAWFKLANVLALEDGGFVIAWLDVSPSDVTDSVHLRRFDAGGIAQGDDTVVATGLLVFANGSLEPELSRRADGGFDLQWRAHDPAGDGDWLAVQEFAADGQALAIEITATASADRIDLSGPGALVAAGGAGDDVYVVNSSADGVLEHAGEGIDSVHSAVGWTLGAAFENLVLTGGAVRGNGNGLANRIEGNSAANRLAGAAGSDTLAGAAGNDFLSGASGRDQLAGGAGADTLQGGAGNDRLLFASPDGVDSLPDFLPGADRIVLDDDGFTGLDASLRARLGAAQFRAGEGVQSAATAAERILYDTATGALYYDADGAGGIDAVQFAQLGASVHPQLGAGDFLLVD